jgi:hypothetical protein
MRTKSIDNKFWNRNSYNVQKWCHVYEDRDTGETIKVKGETDSNNTPYSPNKDGFDERVVVFGNRNHPSLMGRRLRYIGTGVVNVTGLESAKTVPAFSYQST